MTRENTDFGAQADALEAMRNKWLMATPDKTDTPWAIVTASINALREAAAPLHEGEGEPAAWTNKAALDFIGSGPFRSGVLFSWRDPKQHNIALYAAPPPSVEVERLREALDKAVVFNAYNVADPLALRFEFVSETDRLDAANAVDAALSRKEQEPGVPTPGGVG